MIGRHQGQDGPKASDLRPTFGPLQTHDTGHGWIIHQAIEHLKAAGLEEFAEELAGHLHQRRDEERREYHREKREHEEREQHGDRELEELRNHVRELSHALREIQERLENRRDR